MSTLNWSAPFEALEAGQAFTTRGRTVTEADVVGFAALTGDWHRQHTDAVWAAESAFGERIAHGLLVVSLAAGLVPFDSDRVVALRRVADATFKRPVHFGDTLHVTGRIADIGKASDEAGLVAFQWSVVNQDGRTVCRARVEVLWRRDGAAAAADAADADADADADEYAVTGFVPIPL
jgi:acyl dehydratase